MFMEGFIGSLPSVVRILFECAAMIIISVIYIPFYSITRKDTGLMKEAGKTFFHKVILCVVIDLIIIICGRRITVISGSAALLFLLGITADLDLFIKRIPTEFLVILYIIGVKSCFQITGPAEIITVLLNSIFWYLLRRKTRIGAYDILLVIFFSLLCTDSSSVLLFSSIILILWGSVGLILRFVFRKDPQTKLPLAPIIIVSFMLTGLLFCDVIRY